MAKRAKVELPVSPETLDYVQSLFPQTVEPFTAAQISKLLVAPHKLTEAKLVPILNDYVSSSRLHTFPPKTAKGKPRYWDRDASEYGRVLIVAAIARKGPLAKTDLRKAAKLTEPEFDAALKSLFESGRLFEHPPLPKKKTSTIGQLPPSPEPYLKDLGAQLTAVIAQLQGAGVPTAELRRALVQLVDATGIPFGTNAPGPPRSDVAPAVDLLALMQRVEPAAANGALVAARDLRRASGLDKPLFDKTVLDLARQGKLMLHRHDYPGGLTDVERDELVTDGAGTHYVGMAIRRAPA